MPASLILDIILAIISIIIIIKHIIKGFLKSVLDIAKLVLSVVFAILFRASVAKLIDGWFMNAAITGWVRDNLNQFLGGETPGVDFIKIFQDTPQFYQGILTSFGLDYEQFVAQMEMLAPENVDTLASTIATPISMMLCSIIAVIVIFLISLLVLSLVVLLINLLTKIKTINVINRILGFVFGVVISGALIWGVGFVLQAIINMVGPLFPTVLNQDLIDNSVLLGGLDKLGLESLFDGVIPK